MAMVAANIVAMVMNGVFISVDYPAARNVTTDDTTNGVTGTFATPAEEDVETGVEYGYDAEYTGTLVASGNAAGRGFNRGTA